MDPIQFPDRCARCGSPDVATHWQVLQKSAGIQDWKTLREWTDANLLGKGGERFGVPVCRGCALTLERIRRIARQVMISLAIFLGLLFGIMYIAVAVKGDHLLTELVTLLVVVLVGALFGGFIGLIFNLVIKDGFNYDFCSFDGQYFQFKNRNFRRAFAALNPGLVKKRK